MFNPKFLAPWRQNFLLIIYLIQGGFFDCSALKMPKCQTHWKIWHLELFWWDLQCNLTLSHFLGRNSKKTTLYVYWDFELDLLLSEVIHMFKNVKSAKLDRVLCHDGEPPLLGYWILLAYNVDDCKSWSAIVLSSQPICWYIWIYVFTLI